MRSKKQSETKKASAATDAEIKLKKVQMNNTILTDNKEIETLDLPSWWSDDFPCVATLLKTGFKGHRQLFAADVDVLPGVGFAFYEVQWLSKDGSSSDGPLTTIVPFNNIESIEQVETVEAEDGGLK